MVVTTWSRPPGPRLFFVRRLIRIAPTYWLYTTILALLVIADPTFLGLRVTAAHYLNSILFIPHVSPLDGSVSPVLQPGWTLNYEMFFYCVFAAALLIAAPMRAATVTMLLLGLVAAGSFLAPKSAVLQTDTSPSCWSST
jgi:exopolysaccharide production protein ExoZ